VEGDVRVEVYCVLARLCILHKQCKIEETMTTFCAPLLYSLKLFDIFYNANYIFLSFADRYLIDADPDPDLPQALHKLENQKNVWFTFTAVPENIGLS
jgi:hypothetical protein